VDGKSKSADRSAYAGALPLLARKPLTRAELRAALIGRGHAAGEVEDAIDRLGGDGYLDDRKLALHYILARSERLGHAPARLIRELEERGVAAGTALSAWQEAVDDHGLDEEQLLRREARRRIARCGGRLDVSSYRRVYNALLRAGYEPYRIRSELDRFRDFNDSSDDGIEHDLA
jgi:regulatory protein